MRKIYHNQTPEAPIGLLGKRQHTNNEVWKEMKMKKYKWKMIKNDDLGTTD